MGHPPSANNGNVCQITDLGVSGRTKNYSYDQLNRILHGVRADAAFEVTFSYDPWGNLSQSGSWNTGGYLNTNRLIGFNYDLAGNQLNDAAHTYAYNASGLVKTVDATSAIYKYDANGDRVRKDVGSAWTEYVRHAGRPIAERTASGWTDYVFAGSKRIGQSTSLTTVATQYNWSDHLGSSMVQTDVSGAITSQSDYAPFGQEIGGNWASHYKFTGKERDSETGLDSFGARYYGSVLSRFTSPDSLNTLDLSHPQKLNRYAYTANSPVGNVDVGGNCTAPAVSGKEVGICVESYIRTRFLPGVKNHVALARGDNRGPNPHGGSYRTQTLLTVDPTTHNVNITAKTVSPSCAIEGCYMGVNNSELSKISHDKKGNTYFTLTVYGENGYEANNKTGAPGGWIEMQFSFSVNAKGEVTVTDSRTKGYPSASVYSYNEDGDATNLFQQTESGNIGDLFKPIKPAKNEVRSEFVGQSPLEQEKNKQCAGGNPSACD